MSTLFELFREESAVPDKIAPVTLAYAGDTLFDLYLRTALITDLSLSPHAMHEKASSLARASAQAKMAQLILPKLSEEELRVLKHSRNQRSISVPKNASPVDYKWATGFETLLGWLYVSGRDERLIEIMKLAVTAYKEEAENE